MPYYLEQFVNRELRSSRVTNGATVVEGPMVLDSTELMTSRSRPHRDAVYSRELSALSFDPYASFLEETSKRKYQARLDERGLKPEGAPDRGHPFELRRHTIFGQPHTVTSFDGFNTTHYKNVLVTPSIGNEDTTVHGGNIIDPAPYRETGLDAFAQQAYNRTAPTAVEFDAAQFLGELREGLPRLVPELLQGTSSILKRAGSDYLNVEFGWKPFISDLQNAAKALFDTTSSFSQMGKRVHRSYSLPESNATSIGLYTGTVTMWNWFTRGVTTSYLPSQQQGIASSSAKMFSTYALRKYRTSQRWFEGEFTSFLPLGFDPNDYFQRFQVLVNPKITPSVLWELAPWSWLIDWNLRIGDTIRANEINANDRLVMHYGYAMEHSRYETKVDWDMTSTSGASIWTDRPHHGILRSRTEYKRRLRANPYGFRVGGVGSLTGGQSAILGALGLTKLT